MSNRDRILTVEPLPLRSLQTIRESLADHPRNLMIFELGLNSGLRASEIAGLTREHVRDNGINIVLIVRSAKSKRLKHVELNADTSTLLRNYLVATAGSTYIFEGRNASARGGKLQVSTIGNLVGKWAQEADLYGRFASHSLRKTFARTHIERGAKLETMMHVLGHSSPRVTLTYACINAQDVREVYADRV